MYVRVEKHTGFRVRGFRTPIRSNRDILQARQRLFNILEAQRKYPRITYGVMYSQTDEALLIDTYFAGIIGDSSILLESAEEVIVSSGRYVIAGGGENENYDPLEYIKLVRNADYFQFRKAPILETYSRNIETGEESAELWIPIQD
ncbi:MAG: hypothetical protein KBT36_07755 [Kurthia sp.]|nr:hypothetical protein [Candidatus Kurthia equi]